ncbi:AAA family ATPase, partial [bacterium]|nr:AAA family ATPase [bacterium]
MSGYFSDFNPVSKRLVYLIPQDFVMYEQVFNFNSRPFTAAPYVKHYFAGEAIQSALEQTRLNVDRGAGPVVVVGATGTGKTLLLAMLETNYREQVRVVNLACARLQERKDLLQSILHQLQLPFQGLSETELRFALMDYLKPNPNCVTGIVLLVDDAHGLSASLLDELGLITNFVAEGQPRVRLVLAGSHRLEENLNEAKLESLNQRIASRCYLEAMSRTETTRYVVEHVVRVGGDGEGLFPDEACRVIHEVTDGYPRLVNQVADHALMLAATRGVSAITEDCVREAWADVQSIPATFQPQMPAMSEPGDLSGDENWSVLEFGQLDGDEEDESGVAIFTTESESGSVQNSQSEDLETVYESCPEGVEPSDGDLLPMGGELDSAFGDSNLNMLEREQAQILEQVERERMEIYETEESGDGFSFQHEKAESSEEVAKPSELEAVEGGDGQSTMQGLSQNQEVVDPFQESFAEEEVLGDYFAPMVAQQNQASLSIRSVDLADLTPRDTPEDSSPVEEVAADSRIEPPASTETEQRLPVETEYYEPKIGADSVETQSQQTDSDVSAVPEVPSGYEFMMGTDWTSTTADPPMVDPEPIAAPEPQEANGKGFHVHGDDIVSKDIRKQAEEILGRLNSADSSSVNQVSSVAAWESVTENPPIESPVASDAEAAALNYQSAALDESQQILNEILEQRNALAQQGESSICKPSAGEQVPESQFPESQLQVPEKDEEQEKPIIVVNRSEDVVEEKPPVVEPLIPPTAPTSTGKA